MKYITKILLVLSLCCLTISQPALAIKPTLSIEVKSANSDEAAAMPTTIRDEESVEVSSRDSRSLRAESRAIPDSEAGSPLREQTEPRTIEIPQPARNAVTPEWPKEEFASIPESKDEENQELSKFELEQELASIISEIDAKGKLSLKRLTKEILVDLWQKAKENPRTVTTRSALLALTLAALYPTALGSLACLSSYRVNSPSEMFVPDRETALEAVGTMTNTGMGVTYWGQAGTWVFLAGSGLLKDSYHKIHCKAIEDAYKSSEANPGLSEQAKRFLTERADKALAAHRGLPLLCSPRLRDIKIEIDKEIASATSAREMALKLVRQVSKDVPNSDWNTRCKKVLIAGSAIGLSAAALYPLVTGTLACFAAFGYADQTDLLHLNTTQTEEAVAAFSNLGHFIEYIDYSKDAIGLVATALLGSAYQKVKRHIIASVYDKYCKETSLSISDRNTLYGLKCTELAEA